MKALSLLLVAYAPLAWPQAAQPAGGDSPDRVIATFQDGSTMTQHQLETLVPLLPDDKLRAMAVQDPHRFLTTYALMLQAAADFKKEKLDQQSPYKDGLDFAIMYNMADLYVRSHAEQIKIGEDEISAYYNEHKDLFRRVKVSGLEVSFGSAPAADADANSSTALASRAPKKARTEKEALDKAEKLAADLRAGADWEKTMQAESDDEALKAKDGDLGTFGMTENVPDLIRANNVLTLKAGQVADPVRQSGGYYLLHVDTVTYTPMEDAKALITSQLQQQKYNAWLQQFQQSVKVQFPDSDQSPAGAPSGPKK